jgi:hypothetical protein
LKILNILLLSLLAFNLFAAKFEYSSKKFIAESFGGEAPKIQMLWILKDMKAKVKKIMSHRYPALRVRYWQEGPKTLWILNEIGKEKNITAGIIVDCGRIKKVKVLAFRESRGSEVRYNFFTSQFIGTSLRPSGQLSDHIDGVSGATLSVRAVTKVSRLALYFHSKSKAQGHADCRR